MIWLASTWLVAMGACLLGWWARGRVVGPSVVCLNEGAPATVITIRDGATIWCPLPSGPGHWVDVGYDFDGRMVGVQIWADVTTRDRLEALAGVVS